MRILVCDDDTLMRWLYQEEFEADGYEVEIAESGFEAIKKAKARRPDAMIMDCLMEDMDGVEAMERIDPTIPVILCSSCPDLGEDHLENSLAYASLMKSENLSELKRVVRRALNDSRRPEKTPILA